MNRRMAALLMALAWARPGWAAPRVTAVVFPQARLSVEVATTEDEHQLGLMNRDSIATDSGMLFVYGDAKRREFWMKNTRIPLSICFLKPDGTVLNVIDEMKPMDEGPRYRSQGDARYAVEADRNWFTAHGIKAGDRAQFAYRVEKIEGVAYGAQMVKVETVDRPDTVERGLMFRESLAEDAGMLFVFPRPQVLRFWMKNTRIPLSIAFMDAKRKILNIRDMEPFDEKTRHISEGQALYGLEVNKGWFDRHGVKAGEVARFLQRTTEKIAAPGLEAAEDASW